MTLLAPLFIAGGHDRHIALRVIQWLGGLSLSSVILFFLVFLTTIVLRRKGYGVRLGFACLIFSARTGSRRFPDGCEVRVSTRVVGFLFGGCRGPWLDVYADRFFMRLRPSVRLNTVPATARAGSTPGALRRLLGVLRVYVYSVGVAAVETGYWSTLCRNIAARYVAFIIRGLRVRVEKVRVWKDGGSWEYKAEQFVLAGRASGVFGSRYSLSVNELYVSLCKTPHSGTSLYQPINASLMLRRGVEINAYLTPRLFTLLRPRRMAIMDDLRISVNLRDISCTAPGVWDAGLSHVAAEFCPGYSRELRAKLPPSAPATKRPRKPGIFRYWEGSGTISGLSARFSVPTALSPSASADGQRSSMSLPASVADSFPPKLVRTCGQVGLENGAFMRVESVKIEAYGMAADERHEAITHASINIKACSTGSTAVDALSHALYETLPERMDHRDMNDVGDDVDGAESIESIDKIVAARPEALVWLDNITAAVDMNCSKRHSTRVDVGGTGGILALEPVGLVVLIENLRNFVSQYTARSLRTAHSTPNMETDSVSSVAHSSSAGSLQSIGTEGEQPTTRLVSDLTHWTVIVLGHGPVGDGDTMAIVVSGKRLALPQVDLGAGSCKRMVGSMEDLSLTHWSRWARTTNLKCKHAAFDIQKGAPDQKKIIITDAVVDWDLDLQSGLESLPDVFASLRQLKGGARHTSVHCLDDGELVGTMPHLIRGDTPRIQLTESEKPQRRHPEHSRLLRSLASWSLKGTNISIAASFPDGPKLGVKAGELPLFSLGAKTFVGRDVVFTLQESRCLYGAEVKLDSPLHTMSEGVERQSIAIEVQGLRLNLEHEFEFGYLLQDWLLRFRAVLEIRKDARLRKRGLTLQKSRHKPLPDIFFKCSDAEIYFEDDPLGGFLSRMLPLFQDETRERLVREQLMHVRMQQLRRIARAEIAGTAQRCVDALRKSDSAIWLERVRQLKAATPGIKIANGHLPTLELAPVATFVAAALSVELTMDDLVREHGSTESIRRLKMLDDYELGSKKYRKTRQYDSDAWNSIGFRQASLEAVGVRLRLRDYDVAFAVIDRMYIDKAIVGQAVQATVPPYVAETSVAVGKRRVVKVVKGLGPTKTYADIHLIIETLQCGYNPSFLSAIGEFGKGVSRFFGGGKNPSPRIPWFDSLRVNMHGRMRITARKLRGHLTSSISPYSMTKHFADVEADNFEMLTSRLKATGDDPFAISWTLQNWHIRPSAFNKKLRSEVVFDFVRVGLNPLLSTLSGDPQDHYFVPFPSVKEVQVGGPGIGRGTMTLSFEEEPVEESPNGFGNYTVWTTGLHDIPDYDTFKDFKTHKLVLGIDICVRHGSDPQPHAGSTSGKEQQNYSSTGPRVPPTASILHSDSITTLTKVIKKLISRPISCRLAPRRMGPLRKPPSATGISSTMVGLDLSLNARNLNVMLYNNLEPGHGLFVSIASMSGELWKRTHIEPLDGQNVKRSSKLVRKRFDITDIYSGIQAPDLDMGVGTNGMGKLLSVDKISLSDDLGEELQYVASPLAHGVNGRPVSGFGSDDLDASPFYTFSANHPLQRGKKLDKVEYDKRLLVDRLRIVWTPARRTSIAAWPDVFKEKVFCMKAPKMKYGINFAVNDKAEPKTVDSKSSTTTHISDVGKAGLPKSGIFSDMLCDDSDGISDLDLSGGSLRLSGRNAVNLQDNHETRRALEQHKGPLDQSSCDRASHEYESNCNAASHSDPLSPPLLSRTKTRPTGVRRPVGSMVDLLSPLQSKPLSSSSEQPHEAAAATGQVAGEMEVLRLRPKYTLFINDCQVVFGSPETSGYVFLTSKGVRVGIVDKLMQKTMQLGEANERWSDCEYRVHLDKTNFYTRSRSHGLVDYNSKAWVTEDGQVPASMALITRNPISMDLMFISSFSTTRDDDDDEDDYVLRPSLLFINIPDICLSTNTCEYHAVVDVVRKVLMHGTRSSEIVNEELARLRYKLQLAGGKVSSDELDDVMRRLNNVTKQFLYAADTFQEQLVESLLLPDASFADSLNRYKAKAKAVATFMRQDQKASSTDILYPTVYVSYSFDKCSWELRENHRETGRVAEQPFVEIYLHDMVCRHIFYVGRGSSTEATFGNISAENKIKSSYFSGILGPATTGTNIKRNGKPEVKSRIKASDGAPVAFRWYATQEDRVGGIPVYDLLTIQVAPMAASVTTKLYKSIDGFLFPAGPKPQYDDSDVVLSTSHAPPVARYPSRANASGSSMSSNQISRLSNPEGSSTLLKKNGSQVSTSFSTDIANRLNQLDDVSLMAKRGESSVLFKYVFIDAFELTASYKYNETKARGVLDFSNLFVTTPSFSYSSKVWTWKAFMSQLRKDLVLTFARRGVSNLAKIKLLPGYSRARRRFVQGADSVRETIYSRLPNAAVVAEGGSHDRNMHEESMAHLREDSNEEILSEDDENTGGKSSDVEEEDTSEAIDAAVADITGSEARGRELVLAALYGPVATVPDESRGSSKLGSSSFARRLRSHHGSDSSGDSAAIRQAERSGFRPPVSPASRSKTAKSSESSRDSQDIEYPAPRNIVYPGPQAPRASLLMRIRRKAHDVASD